MKNRETKDSAMHKTVWKIKKYKNEEDFKNGKPFEEKIIKENILLNGGIGLLWDLAIGNGGTAFDNTNARIGVGDGTTAEDATQTGLQGTHTAYQSMSEGYPQRNGTTVVFKAVFHETEANFAWNEFSVDNGEAALNRKFEPIGTKYRGQIWVMTVSITIT